MLTQTFARLLLAPILVLSIAVLVKGFVDTGDGFSAGVIASLAVILQYLAFGRSAVVDLLPVRRAAALAFAGLLLALTVALIPFVQGKPVLQHAPGAGASVTKVGTLELTTTLVLDVAIFLLVVGAVVGILDAIARRAQEGER